MVRRVLAVLAAAVGSAPLALACGSFASDDGGADAGAEATMIEGGSAVPLSDAGGHDACTRVVADSFDDENATMTRWKLIGRARVDPALMEAELVPDQPNATGIMFHHPAKAIDCLLETIHVHYKVRIDAKSGAADGLTFVWASNAAIMSGASATTSRSATRRPPAMRS